MEAVKTKRTIYKNIEPKIFVSKQNKMINSIKIAQQIFKNLSLKVEIIHPTR